MSKISLQARQRCATFLPGAKHTTKQAGNLPVNEVFSRPNTSVLGLGTVNRKATGSTCFECLNPVPPNDLSSQKAGFSVQQGTRTMQTTTPEMGTIPRFTSTSTAHPERLAITPAIDLLQRADNALAMARWHLRKQSSPEVIRLATGKAVSAARALKQACAESNTQGRA